MWTNVEVSFLLRLSNGSVVQHDDKNGLLYGRWDNQVSLTNSQNFMIPINLYKPNTVSIDSIDVVFRACDSDAVKFKLIMLTCC